MRTGLPLFLLSLFTVAGPVARDAAAQASGTVAVPPVEVGTALSYDIPRDRTFDLTSGPGAILMMNGNLNDHVAVATELTRSPRVRAMMCGGRISTGFFQEGRGLPGRFFADLLVGVRDATLVGSRTPAMQLGVGADAMVVRRGLLLHWGLDYLFEPSAPHVYAGARLSVGLIAGPRISK